MIGGLQCFLLVRKAYPLQYMLYQILFYSTFAQDLLLKNAAASRIDMPKETLKLALTVVVTGPIVLAFPFAQKILLQV